MTRARLVQIGVTLELQQFGRLKALSQTTRVSMAEFVREAIDAVLERQEKRVKHGVVADRQAR